MDEHLVSSSRLHPKFGTCCLQGKISLPPLQPPPPELLDLLTSQEFDGKEFRKHICNYNNALAMTSVGRKLDNSLNRAGGLTPSGFMASSFTELVLFYHQVIKTLSLHSSIFMTVLRLLRLLILLIGIVQQMSSTLIWVHALCAYCKTCSGIHILELASTGRHLS
jgi:hypothetical protein